MTIRNLYPDIKPTLNLNFAKVKALDPRITFTRVSGATYYDADGVLRTASNNQARFDHDPVSGGSLGLLIEEQRTNLFLNSGIGPSLTNWVTSSTPPTITFDQLAPDGSNDAILLDDTSTTFLSFVRQLVSVPNDSTTYTCSFYAKAGSTDRVYFRPALTGGTAVFTTNVFNFTTRTFSSGSMSPRYQDVGNGWVRISFGFANNSTGNVTFDLRLSSATGTTTVESTGTVYLWGAQLEAGAFPTSYIKTETSQVTRLADSASMTGTNFSSWYRPDEGTLYVEANTPAVAAAYVFADINSNSLTNYIRQSTATNGTNNQFVIQNAGVTEASPGIVVTLGSRRKMAGGYAFNDVQQSVNGTLGTQDTSATIPSGLSQINIGTRSTGVNAVNGHIRKISYYPQRLTNTQLQALTR
jgi:hypothetical protein